MNKPLKVFITYSHRDREAKGELVTRLSVMVQNGLIEIWHDNEILPGDRWSKALSNNLQTSDILLYLVSAASLASKNCNEELTEALKKASLRIIPIILEACDWLGHRSSDFQALPDFGKPITAWEPQSDGWQNVVQGIRKNVEDMLTPAQSSPGTKPAKPDLANFLPMLGQLDKAVDAYSHTIHLDKQNAYAYHRRGIAKGGLGQFEEAIADFDKALDLDPQNADTYYYRGLAKVSLAQSEGAIADFNEILRLNPGDAYAYLHRGLAKVSLAQFEEAIVDFDTAICLNPQFAEAYYSKGLAEGGIGRHEEARANFQRAIELATEQGNEELARLAQEALNKSPSSN